MSGPGVDASFRAEPRTGADANSLRSCVAAALGAAHRERSASQTRRTAPSNLFTGDDAA